MLCGLLWLVHQAGWDSGRVEEELLPRCWEQTSHRYIERRILVAQTVTVLAPSLQINIRSSLLLSILRERIHKRSTWIFSSLPLEPFNNMRLPIC